VRRDEEASYAGRLEARGGCTDGWMLSTTGRRVGVGRGRSLGPGIARGLGRSALLSWLADGREEPARLISHSSHTDVEKLMLVS
jgi:hypothetical protein